MSIAKSSALQPFYICYALMTDTSLTDIHYILFMAPQLAEYCAQHNLFKKYRVEQLPQEVHKTFGYLQQEQKIKLTFANELRPFKRCLSFQAMQAVARARAEGWLPEGWDAAGHVVDYMTEDGDGLWYDKVHSWLQQCNVAEESSLADED